MYNSVVIHTIMIACLLTCSATAQNTPSISEADQAYIKEFHEKFPPVNTVPTLETYATVDRYDKEFMGDSLDACLKDVQNDHGGLAWGMSYRMRSLNEMYQVTKQTKYLEANLRLMRAVLAATDDKRGKQLFTGRVVPAWGCDKYAERGRAVFAVHTGIILTPIVECLRFVKDNPALRTAVGDEFDALIKASEEALAVHDRQWRDGPETRAGYYIGMDQENSLENKPLPGNRISAMGTALWASWKLTGNIQHKDRAIAIATYIKHRLFTAPDGAYYWPYQLATAPVTEPKIREEVSGEDASHGGLTMSLLFTLARENEVITQDDMQRFACTVKYGITRLQEGILLGGVTGSPKSKPDYIGYASNWLQAVQNDPQTRNAIIQYYLKYKPSPQPLDLSSLLLYGGKTK